MLNGEKTDVEIDQNFSTSSNPVAMNTELHRKQIQNLVNAAKGIEPLLIDAREGRKAVKIIEEIYNISKKLKEEK